MDLARLEILAAEPGCYDLLLSLPTPQNLLVGALGRCGFAAGWYVYCGSAQRGLRGRVQRHLRHAHRSGVRHWHVDYLLAVADVEEAWLWPHAPRTYECDVSRALTALPGARRAVAGFGSSDCRCPGHLIAFTTRPESVFSAVLGTPDHGSCLATLSSRSAVAASCGQFCT